VAMALLTEVDGKATPHVGCVGGGWEPGGEGGCDGRGWRMARAEPSGRTLHLIDSSHSNPSAADRSRSLTRSSSSPSVPHKQVTFLLLALGCEQCYVEESTHLI